VSAASGRFRGEIATPRSSMGSKQTTCRVISRTCDGQTSEAKPPPWELRLGEVRVFYAVADEPEALVTIAAVGIRRHNELWIGTERVEL